MVFKTFTKPRLSTNKRTSMFVESHVVLKVLLYILISKVKTNAEHKIADVSDIKVSMFILPKKNIRTIFLRAPYKNKLARLDIVRTEHTHTINIFTKSFIQQSQIGYFLTVFNNMNICSSLYIHKKTVAHSSSFSPDSFLFKNYN